MSDKYSTWKTRAEQHDATHFNPDRRRIKEDLSCSQCYPLIVTNKKFIRFWKWYREVIPQVIDHTSKTEEVFSQYLEVYQEYDSKDRSNRIKGKIGKLLGCMRYENSPELTESEIRQKLLEITNISLNFEKPVKQIEEFWK